MAVLRCERVAAGEVDAAIAKIGSATLARTPEGVFIAIEDEVSERARRLLAFAGVRATAGDPDFTPRPGTRPAIGRGLTPLPLPVLMLDLVHVRTLPLGAETQRLLRSHPWRRLNARRRALVRDLLRGDDAALGWRRRAWTTRGVLRTSDARRALQAVVFDISAIGAPPEHRILAREGAIARWLFS